MSAIDCQRRIIAQYAIISRIVILFAMSISCKLLPNFHPGDDVLQFDMRLIPHQPDKKERTCYCLQGHSCDTECASRRRIDDISISCADNKDTSSSTRYVWLDNFYAFILPPVTQWDGARFLSLSVDPWARYPHMITKDDIDQSEKTADQTCNNNEDTTTTCTDDNSEEYNIESQFASSEQAHAFFPLLPLSIRYTAKLLMQIIPASILPPTYEATLVLSTIIINMLAFVIASISLYDLTIFILKRQALEKDSNKPAKQNAPKQPNIILDEETHHVHLANTAAQLFCINPAGVFFTAAYSESIFAMLTFAGHAFAARGQYCQSYLDKRKGGDMIIRDLKSRSYIISCLWWANLYWIPSTILWMLASFTRSNGTFSSIWWMLIVIAKCCSYIKLNKGKDVTAIIEKITSLLLFYGTLATFVALPVLYHDLQGYNNHCSGTSNLPTWCKKQDGRFFLYAYVQRKHWNVGLFRYYELKQIPNFILALPVLILSLTAATLWIKHSWNRHIKGRMRGVQDVFRWVYLALSASSSDYQKQKQKEEDNNNNNNNNLLLGPKFLSYYAILFGFAMVGTFLAHVQISTRLICSSCPALYWFVAHLMLSDNRCDERRSGVRVLIYFHFVLYNILGAIMHVNWLPWT